MANLVSIVVPNYNCLMYLNKCLNSILMQKNVQYEILIIDDGSDDGSLAWLEKAQHCYSQVRVIKQSRKGVVKARNLAIQKAHGDYIAFLDADDYWSHNKLAEQWQYLRDNPNVVLSFTNYMHVDEAYQPIVDCFGYWPEFKDELADKSNGYRIIENGLGRILECNVIGTSTVMVRKDAIIEAGCFDPTLKSASDWDCWLRIAALGDIAFTPQVCAHYLMRSNSITANKRNRLTAMADIIERISQLPQITQRNKRNARSALYEGFGEFYREKGMYLHAARKAMNSLLLNPNKRRLMHLMFDCKHLIKGHFKTNL